MSAQDISPAPPAYEAPVESPQAKVAASNSSSNEPHVLSKGDEDVPRKKKFGELGGVAREYSEPLAI